VQLSDDYLNVLLPRACQQKFLGLRVARKAQRGVLFKNFVNCRPDAVLIGARFWLDRKRDRWLGGMWQRKVNGCGFVAERVARKRVFEFRDGSQIAGVQLRYGGRRFSFHHLDVLQSFGRAPREILQRRVILENARHHLEISDPSGEWIGQRLEHKNGDRLGVADLSRYFASLVRGLAVTHGRPAFRRIGKHVGEQV
jgi:hypothetical protein